MKEVYLAGGCFWGLEKAIRCLEGIIETKAGYANGHVDDPDYGLVCSDTTGHRETVKVVYDENELPLERILKAYFICIDPTVQNRQGNDIGSQYQTGIYYTDEESHKAAEDFISSVKNNYDVFYVELDPLDKFWEAEEYHQQYLEKNPAGYCHIGINEFNLIKKLNHQES